MSGTGRPRLQCCSYEHALHQWWTLLWSLESVRWPLFYWVVSSDGRKMVYKPVRVLSVCKQHRSLAVGRIPGPDWKSGYFHCLLISTRTLLAISFLTFIRASHNPLFSPSEPGFSSLQTLPFLHFYSKIFSDCNEVGREEVILVPSVSSHRNNFTHGGVTVARPAHKSQFTHNAAEIGGRQYWNSPILFPKIEHNFLIGLLKLLRSL